MSTTDPDRATGTAFRLRRSILARTALLSWMVVLLAVLLFTLSIIPYQRSILVSRLASFAEVLATSIEQVTVTSVVVEDYSPVIEHCMKVVRERPAVRYLVVRRRDGFSLVHRESGWRNERLDERWNAPRFLAGDFVRGELSPEEVYHYTYPLTYSNIEWGWIYVGLSREPFARDMRAVYQRTLVLAGLCLLAASVAALLTARRVTRPIQELSRVTERVTAGDLAARAHIETGDEVESLARSFNQMTETLVRSREELEERVDERTAELRAANERLSDEVRERRRAEQELAEQRSLRLRSDRLRSLGEMATGIAHELNQPLVGVRGITEHLLISMERDWELPRDKLRERLEMVLGQADRMVHIIEHVRRFAREAGKPEVSHVQVNDVVTSATDLLRSQFSARGLELEIVAAPALSPVLANPYSLEEVLINLLTNARDAVEEKTGGEGGARVSVVTAAADGGVVIEVRDEGVGIRPELLERVFDPFFTTKDPERGTGLGLSISRSIVEGLGGSLELRSEPGIGTTVRIFLPAEATPADARVASGGTDATTAGG